MVSGMECCVPMFRSDERYSATNLQRDERNNAITNKGRLSIIEILEQTFMNVELS
jgi:hypothetical protein